MPEMNPIQQTERDIEFEEFMNALTQKVCNIYRVNGSELGMKPVFKRPEWIWKALCKFGIPERKCVQSYTDRPTYKFPGMRQ